MSWPLAFTLIALLIAAVVLIIFLRLESWPARTSRPSSAELERLGKDLRAAFIDVAHLQPAHHHQQPRPMEQTSRWRVGRPIKTHRSRTRTVHTPLAAQRVKLHGTFVAKAGFDLQQDLSIDIRPTKLLFSSHAAQTSVLSRSRWTSSRLKTVCGTEFPGRSSR
jgi:hypothetical protein